MNVVRAVSQDRPADMVRPCRLSTSGDTSPVSLPLVLPVLPSLWGTPCQGSQGYCRLGGQSHCFAFANMQPQIHIRSRSTHMSATVVVSARIESWVIPRPVLAGVEQAIRGSSYRRFRLQQLWQLKLKPCRSDPLCLRSVTSGVAILMTSVPSKCSLAFGRKRHSGSTSTRSKYSPMISTNMMREQ